MRLELAAIYREPRRGFGISAGHWYRQSAMVKNSKNGQFKDEFLRYSIADLERFGFEVKLEGIS
jgi:hypothetical protein